MKKIRDFTVKALDSDNKLVFSVETLEDRIYVECTDVGVTVEQLGDLLNEIHEILDFMLTNRKNSDDPNENEDDDSNEDFNDEDEAYNNGYADAETHNSRTYEWPEGDARDSYIEGYNQRLTDEKL